MKEGSTVVKEGGIGDKQREERRGEERRREERVNKVNISADWKEETVAVVTKREQQGRRGK